MQFQTQSGHSLMPVVSIKTRRGRKRKSGQRKENGRLARSYENPKAQVMAQPHRMAVPVEFRDRTEPESEFGRLMCLGVISPAQHEAGNRYRELAMRYRSMLLAAPGHSAPSIAFGEPRGGRGAEPSREAIQAVKKAYDAAFIALGEAGNRAQRAVKDFAVFERRTQGEYDRALLKLGLNKLITHFGIDPNAQIRLRAK